MGRGPLHCMPMEQRPPSPSDSSGGRSGRRRDPAPVTPAPAGQSLAAFAHASEAELARILDFYAVRWEYEPHTFPILWNLDGVVVESFSPDFWLPDLDLYLELTTLKQSLVRKKNRKLRRLRELYPDVRVKLFYGRDFRALMLKYGKLGLIDELSGTSGQASPIGQEDGLEDVPRTGGSAPTAIPGARLNPRLAPPPPSPTVPLDPSSQRRSTVVHPATLGSRTARARRPGSSTSSRSVKER